MTVIDVVVEIAKQPTGLGPVELAGDRREQVVPSDLTVGQEVEARRLLLVDNTSDGGFVGVLELRIGDLAPVVLVEHLAKIHRQRGVAHTRVASSESAPKHQRILPRKKKTPAT